MSPNAPSVGKSVRRCWRPASPRGQAASKPSVVCRVPHQEGRRGKPVQKCMSQSFSRKEGGMPGKPEAVLVIGLRETENETELVRALGYRVLYFNSIVSLDDALRVDVPVELDLNNADAVLAHALTLAGRFTVRAVYTLNEYHVPLASRIAAALDIQHGLPVAAALNCRHKKRTKLLLSRHSVGTARFA